MFQPELLIEAGGGLYIGHGKLAVTALYCFLLRGSIFFGITLLDVVDIRTEESNRSPRTRGARKPDALNAVPIGGYLVKEFKAAEALLRRINDLRRGEAVGNLMPSSG
jgi:hypothetical protein